MNLLTDSPPSPTVVVHPLATCLARPALAHPGQAPATTGTGTTALGVRRVRLVPLLAVPFPVPVPLALGLTRPQPEPERVGH